MRTLGIIGAFLILALPTPVARDSTVAAEEKPEQLPIGALHVLQRGDCFIYKMRFPGRGFRGYPGVSGAPNIKIPKRQDDFENRILRLVVLQGDARKRAARVHARLDEVDDQGRLVREGLYFVELVSGGNEIAMSFWLGGKGSALHLGPSGTNCGIRFPFAYYPPFRTIVRRSAEKTVQFRREWDKVIEYRSGFDEKKTLVTLDIRTFDGVAESEVDKRKEVCFFDKKSGRVLAEATAEQRAVLKPVVPGDRETQTWEVGAPFFSDVVRYNAAGHFLFQCKLLRRGKTELPQETRERARAGGKNPELDEEHE